MALIVTALGTLSNDFMFMECALNGVFIQQLSPGGTINFLVNTPGKKNLVGALVDKNKLKRVGLVLCGTMIFYN